MEACVEMVLLAASRVSAGLVKSVFHSQGVGCIVTHTKMNQD